MKPDAAASSSNLKSNSVEPKSVFRRLQRKLSPKMKSEEDGRDRDGRGNVASACAAAESSADNIIITSRTPKSNSSSRGGANIQQLQVVFDFFDENRDGKISAAELQSCVRTVAGEISMEEAATAVESLDKDGDGLLGLDEFRELMEGGTSTEEELREAFGMYVTNGSNGSAAAGCITPQSLKRMLSRLGDSRSIDDCKTMIRAFDLNGDGVLSFDEFKLMMA